MGINFKRGQTKSWGGRETTSQMVLGQKERAEMPDWI